MNFPQTFQVLLDNLVKKLFVQGSTICCFEMKPCKIIDTSTYSNDFLIHDFPFFHISLLFCLSSDYTRPFLRTFNILFQLHVCWCILKCSKPVLATSLLTKNCFLNVKISFEKWALLEPKKITNKFFLLINFFLSSLQGL